MHSPESDTPQNPSSSVLIVEDDEGIRQALDALLESYSVPVSWAGSATEASQILDNATRLPSMVVVDGRLPDKHGLDLIRDLRQRLPAEAEIFLFTADASVDDRLLETSGATGFLRKPFDIERLIDLAVRYSVQ